MLLFLILSITASDVLDKVDAVMNAPKDREAKMITVVIDKNGKKKERKTAMWQKGDKRLIRFLSPAEDRGIGFLSITDNRMYLYMPAFNRVRRIASHVKKQSFMDTDFSYDDLSSSHYQKDWSAKIISQNDSLYVLKLIPKKGTDIDYSYAIMTVNKKNYLMKSIEFYKGEKLKKKMIMQDYKKVGKYWTAQRMEMDNIEKNHKTIMIMKEIKFDQGLSDKIFTQRFLKRV